MLSEGAAAAWVALLPPEGLAAWMASHENDERSYPLRIGSLVVTHLGGNNKSPNGVYTPRRMTYPRIALTDEYLKRGARTYGSQRQPGLYRVKQIFFNHNWTVDQLNAAEHADICARLDATPAGRKARDLLFDHLIEDQRKSAERYRFFDEVIWSREREQRSLEREEPVRLDTIAVRFHRGFPNGNVELHGALIGGQISLCIHPPSPFPNDDVVLSQLLALREDPEEFIRMANGTFDGRPTKFKGMFQRDEPPKLVAIGA